MIFTSAVRARRHDRLEIGRDAGIVLSVSQGGRARCCAGLILGLVTYGGLLVLLVQDDRGPAVRAAPSGQPLCDAGRLPRRISHSGPSLIVRGTPMTKRGAVVANHSSWLDIFSLNAAQRIYFVSKSEVAGWPGIGWLARATGTVVHRPQGHRGETPAGALNSGCAWGISCCSFPRAPSTDATRVLPFKSTLFQAFYTHGLDRVLHIQPVTVVYQRPRGQDARFYGWWGDMGFAPHLLMTLAARRQGTGGQVIFHPPVPVDAFESRKQLAAHCERVIRSAHPVGGHPSN